MKKCIKLHTRRLSTFRRQQNINKILLKMYFCEFFILEVVKIVYISYLYDVHLI